MFSCVILWQNFPLLPLGDGKIKGLNWGSVQTEIKILVQDVLEPYYIL